jgi:two-component system nitrate/nitrite sensor histidine kinase NarX
MPLRLPASLVFRTGLTLGAIVVLALVSIITSVVVADYMEGDAEAINMAGSLRMQGYRIAHKLDATPTVLAAEIADFETRLYSAILRGAAASDGELGTAYEALASRWRREMLPLVNGLARDPVEYRAHIDDFVAQADAFVTLLQHASESKVQALRVIQGTVMFLTLALVFAAMYGLNQHVLAPLNELILIARRFGSGDFSARVSHETDDELGILGSAFNTMAADLSLLYAELEARVQAKTLELRRNGDALEMLYRLSRLFAAPGNVQARLPVAMGMLAAALRVRPVFTSGGDLPGDFRIVTPDGEFPSTACAPERRDPTARWGDPAVPRPVRVFPVRGINTLYGQLSVEPESGHFEPWQEPILRSAAEILATAISLAGGEERTRKLLLMEERAVIARELHDSLAQSLSYLKIQVSRLEAMLSRNASTEETGAIIGDLREGLNSAYRQLRELLTTFRLRMNASGLEAALRETLQEFEERGLTVQADLRLTHCPLAAQEELHVLQIAREALSNVLRHAGTEQARMSLFQRPDGAVELAVEDEGCGIADTADSRRHHGLVIMRERAATLGGTIAWSPGVRGGTRVTLVFRPSYLSRGA